MQRTIERSRTGGTEAAGVIPETVVLRRELHAVHEKLDGSLDVNECILAALKSARLEAAEAKVGRDKSEEENAELKALLKQGGASDSEIQYRQRCVQLQKCAKLEEELVKARARHKRPTQTYKCLKCKKRFSHKPGFENRRHPPRLVIMSIMLISIGVSSKDDLADILQLRLGRASGHHKALVKAVHRLGAYAGGLAEAVFRNQMERG